MLEVWWMLVWFDEVTRTNPINFLYKNIIIAIGINKGLGCQLGLTPWSAQPAKEAQQLF